MWTLVIVCMWGCTPQANDAVQVPNLSRSSCLAAIEVIRKQRAEFDRTHSSVAAFSMVCVEQAAKTVMEVEK